MKISTATFPLIAAAALVFVFSAAGAQAAPIKYKTQQQNYNDDYNDYDNGYDSDKPYCREFTQTFSIGGEKETGYGTACLQPDGSWEIVSQGNNNKQNSDINYVVREEKVFVEPREVVFAPGHYWHRRPVAYIGIGHRDPHYYHWKGYRHNHRHHRYRH